MTYHLHFYKKKDDDFTEQSFANYLTNFSDFHPTEESNLWLYQNEQTGVYCWIERNKPIVEKDDIQGFDNFDQYKNLNFTFCINLFTPRFFGFEAFPLIELIISENDLWILNPQDEADLDTPRKFASGYLMNKWIEYNDKLSIKQFNELGIDYYPLEKSNAMWRYLYNRNNLQSNLKSIFVPGYLMLKSNEDGKLYTVCVWPEHIPILMPPVDFVLIFRTKKSLFKTKEESGLISYQSLMSKFESYFEPFDHEISNLLILRQKNADLISREFNELVIRPEEEFSGVSFDEFVNVRP